MNPREAWWFLDHKKPAHVAQNETLVKQVRQWRAEGKTKRKRRA